MRKIFCKSTEQRRRKFQIYTSVVQDDDIRYVIKEAVFDEGKEHIDTIYDNYHILSKLHPGKVVECEKIEDNIRFPFLEGTTFDEILCDKICSGIDDNDLKQIIKKWEQFLIGKPDNVVPFDNSNSFQQIFGNGYQLFGDKALKITNFDCIGENIIITQQGAHFIDYEWVFDFPIPLELCFFRVLKMFFLKNKHIISFDRLLKMAGIVDVGKIELYEKFLDAFDLYISYDEQLDILYANLGKIYKEGRILATDGETQIKFTFPYNALEEGSKLVLYGAGEVGLSYYRYLQANTKYQLIAWVDKKYEQYVKSGLEVCAVDTIEKKDFDYILIAIYNDKVAHIVMDELEQRGVEKERIIWKKPQYL